MSERFIKFIPSEEATYLLTQKGHAFRLLTIIAQNVRLYDGGVDGLKLGEAFIGGHENYDMTEQNYRTAKEILVRRQHIEIVETSRTRKKVTNGVTTAGTKVKLLSSSVWDLNLESDNELGNERVTNDQRTGNDKLRMIDRNMELNGNEYALSPKITSINDLTFSSETDVSKKANDNLKHKIYSQTCQPSFEILKGVFISQPDLDECVKMKGSIEAVKESIKFILDSPNRKKPSAIGQTPFRNGKPNFKQSQKIF